MFERGDKRGKKNSSIEYMFDKKGGTPTRIGNRWDTEHYRVRYRNPKYFNMYHSYSMESEELMLERGEDHRALVWWKTRAFKLLCIIIALVVLVLGFGVFLFVSTSKTLNGFGKKKIEKHETVTTPIQPVKTIKLDNQDYEKVCYEQIWVNDGVVTYKLNNGNYAYNPSYLIERCSRLLEWREDKNR